MAFMAKGTRKLRRTVTVRGEKLKQLAELLGVGNAGAKSATVDFGSGTKKKTASAAGSKKKKSTGRAKKAKSR